jgi:hypothetical protein
MKTQWTALVPLLAALLLVACGNGGSSEKEPAQSNWPDDAEGPAGTGGGVRVFGGAAGTLSAARSCTHEPGADGDRWCAFIGRSSEGDHNLFAVNVSQVKAGVPVACGSEDPNCLLLTDHVEGSSADFHPSFFQGDTLVYYDRDLAAYAWRPGMTAGRLLARRNTERDIAYCTPAPRGLAVACLSMPSEQPEGAVVVAELLAASVDWEEEPLLRPIASVIAATGDDNVTVHRFGFAALADGYVGWSARETETGPEILKLQRVDDPDSQITVATDIHHWAVTEDGSSWLWMARTSEGSVGTLQIAPFPNGAQPVDLLDGVIDYKLTSNGAVVAETEQHTAVSIVDPNGAPARHVLLGDEIGKISALSDEGQVAFAKRPIGSQFTDFIVSSLDGTRSCVLETTGSVSLNAIHFAPGADGVLWAARSNTDKFDAFLSRLGDCNTAPLSPDIVVMGWAGSGHAVFIDDYAPDTASGSLRYRKAGRDGELHPDPPSLIAEHVDTYTTWGDDFILYTISAGSDDDGMYVRAFGR